MQHQISFQDLLFGKTFPEPSAAIKEQTSELSSKPSAKLKTAMLMFLNLTGGGWKPSGCVVGNGYSIAWRVYDAQYWGVPQRRKRIYLIADFRSERAGEILFVEQGESRDLTKSEKAWERASRYVAGCPVGRADGGTTERG